MERKMQREMEEWYVDDILDDRCNERRWNTLYEATGR